MVCYTATIFVLRHNQIFILIIFMFAKLNKKFISKEKIENILRNSLFCFTRYLKITECQMIHQYGLRPSSCHRRIRGMIFLYIQLL